MKRIAGYESWHSMKQRCNNSNNKDYHYYGGRGIKVCKRWNNFKNFLEDMGKKPFGLTLERKDNNGNYEPGNCCWVTRKKQASNTRKQYLFIAMDFQGTMIISKNQHEFAKQHELSYCCINDCLCGRQKTHKKWRFKKVL